jgi:molybdopterin-guanine dinucleotide biosynthesis protein A
MVRMHDGGGSPDLSPLAGVILCGGASRRMGSDKALLAAGNERLVDRAARRLATVADPVFLACGARPLVVAGCTAVGDAADGAGPLGGVVAGLRASPHQLTAIVAVDMPWFDPDLLIRMAAQWAGEDALVPLSASRMEPLHAVYARSAVAVLEDALAAGRLRMLDALDGLRVRRFDAADAAGARSAARFATNLNTPEDVLSLWADPREGA